MRFFYALLLVSLFAAACGSEEPQAEKEVDYAALIIGEWETLRGLQNGEASDRLKDFSFRFTKERLESSILEQLLGAGDAAYKIDGKRIVFVDQPSIAFTIEELKDEQLRISFEVEEHQFDFTLTKKGTREPSAASTEGD